jgi:hypothetical protein
MFEVVECLFNVALIAPFEDSEDSEGWLCSQAKVLFATL